ncbi:hypothetical protein IC607_16690 [Cellulomonas sp. JH27-2]|uniref:hypothetical protein n=1 Tax=Cellulomonas sp. JH27-2 TaxID=2774139 RepID=UPI00177CE65E|nr:hypothetical protein [Cellulomonas sp. JH27-2]MBD8060607.1 hypothetical protein [Cellulomonas sp. JH27-2]
MLVAAALVPDTALLVPGAGGRADAGAGLRTAALAVVGAALDRLRTADDVSDGTVVVVAPGRRTRELTGTVVGSLQAAGVPDDLLGWPAPTFQALDGPPTQEAVGVSAAVALHLLARAGWRSPLRVVEVDDGPADDDAGDADVADLTARGAALVADRPTVLVVVGSGSGRHGPDAPLADDPDAPAYDADVLAELGSGTPDALDRLRALDPARARALAVTGRAPWQVLVGAVGARSVTAHLETAEVAAGAQHAALRWVIA